MSWLTRMFKSKKGYKKEAVQTLLEVCPKVPRWVRTDPSPEMKKIREIGETANALGGKAYMQELHADFVRSGGGQWGRAVESMWSGIGHWSG